MVKYGFWYLGGPIIIPVGLVWGVEHQYLYESDYLSHLGLLIWLLIGSYLVWSKSSEMVLRGFEKKEKVTCQ